MDAPRLSEIDRDLKALLAGYRPELLDGAAALEAVKLFSHIERMAASGKLLTARHIERTNGWRRQGHRSAEEWLASSTGVSPAAAATTLATGRRLEQLPATEEALRAGNLSEPQAAAVTSAGDADPTCEPRLLQQAATGSLARLRHTAQQIRAAAHDTRIDRDAIHRTRYLRTWTADDGATEGRFRLTPDHGATLLSAIAAQREAVFARARQDGQRDRSDAYDADALVEMARAATDSAAGGATGGSGRVVHLRVDHATLLRGEIADGEICEVPDVGPVPVATAVRLVEDATVKVIVTDGHGVADVRTMGRTIPARIRAALMERDQTCVVPGCSATKGLEIHHLVPFSLDGPTSLHNLARVCGWHHDQITYHGARLTGLHPHWQWTPPGSASSPSERKPSADDPPGSHSSDPP